MPTEEHQDKEKCCNHSAYGQILLNRYLYLKFLKVGIKMYVQGGTPKIPELSSGERAP